MTICILFAILGLLLGSFLNVCIVRLPRSESIVWPRSHCRSCAAVIASYDNVPVLSWLWLGGKCRTCKAPITWRYPAVELATCALCTLCCRHFGFAWPAAAWSLLCFLLLGLAVMDAETLLLPDLFTLPGIGAGILWAGVQGPGRGFALRAAGRSALAAAAAAGTLLLIIGIYWLVRRRIGMGFGDVKLLALLGAWLGVPQTALTLFLAVIAGALYGAIIVLQQKRSHHEGPEDALPLGQVPVPFGTMLCLGGLYSIFLGERTLGWYLQLLS